MHTSPEQERTGATATHAHTTTRDHRPIPARPAEATPDAHAVPARPGAAALPGSLAAQVAGGQPATLVFPGIDIRWPEVLADTLLGRPALTAWVDEVTATLDEWVRTPAVRALGVLPDGLSPVLARGAQAPELAGGAPALLVGTVLADLAGLMALESEGLTVPAGTRAAGHSAGLLAAWVAGAPRRPDGLVPVPVAADALRVAAVMGAHAARHPWSVSDSAVRAARAGSESAATPMVAVTGARSDRLRAALDDVAGQLPGEVVIAVTNSRTRHVLAGSPAALSRLRGLLEQRAQADAARRSAGRLGGAPFRFAWEPLPSPAPFHHPALREAADAAVAQARSLGITLPASDEVGHTVLDPATAAPLAGPDPLAAIVHSILAAPHDWAGTVPAAVGEDGLAVLASPLGALAGVTASCLRGRGAVVVDPSTREGREALFTPGRAPAHPVPWRRYAPAVVRMPDGALRLDNRHTRLTGRSPMILPGMTPTTAEAPIVAAAANGGHVAELAGGGQVSERIFTERVRELTELLDPGQGVVLNAMYLDPYLWGLHLGRERLLLRARSAGAPFLGVTVSAGIPEKAEAVALLDELVAHGLWLNAFKPGTVAQVGEVLSIAADTPHTVWLHLEGGAAGGHHSWEDLEELLLATYHKVRQHDNVVLAVGGGIADEARAGALLTGEWALAHGAPVMPVDAVLLGTVTMATAESATSAAVKAALAAAPGHPGWVGRGQVAGGTTSGRSGLDADIHYLDNSAARAARLLDEVAGDAEAAAARREEIIEALSRTAKPYFGDAADMTYAELLERFVALTALGRAGRYEDGAWLDPSHRARFIALLQRAEARLHEADSGEVPTLFGTSETVDDPSAAVAALLGAHPDARTALLHPADVAHFLAVCRQPGKPVPFVPVIDADVRRWYQSDSLWQSHSDRYAADEVLIIPGPTAVAGITTVDEPVAALLDRFESAVADSLTTLSLDSGALTAGSGDPVAEVGFRPTGEAAASAGERALLRAALDAPTWDWLGVARPNPLHRIAPAGAWAVEGGSAVWDEGPDERAALVTDSGALELVLTWPDLGLVGDGRLALPVAARVCAGTVTFAVTEEGLAAAGGQLLAMVAAGTGVAPAGAGSDTPGSEAAGSEAAGSEAAGSDAAGTGSEAAGSAAAGSEAAAPGSGSLPDPNRGLAAAHAATVGAGTALPDRVMARIWPPLFAALAEGGLAPGILDLVHLRHELAASPGGAGVRVSAPQVSAADGGLVVTVRSGADGVALTDRFFVRRPGTRPQGDPDAAAHPAADLGPGLDDPTPADPAAASDAADPAAASAAADADRGAAELEAGHAEAVPTPARTLGTLTVTAPARLESFATVSGDANPIHRSDALARLVGLPGRIVHGMWTSAAATRAVIETAAAGDPDRLREWAIDFVAPVLPGQQVTLTVRRTAVRDGARVVSVEAATADGVVALGTGTVAPPRTVYVFPGQGIQSQGMGMDGYTRSAAARAVWDRADAITRERLGFSILRVVRDNPATLTTPSATHRHPKGVLNLTQFTQVAMATLAAAQVAELREAGVFDPDAAVAGHSVGEYNALAASAGVLPLDAVVELVFARGQSMHGLVPRDAEGRSQYRLAVIRPHLAGLTHAEAEALVDRVAAETGELCEIVNHNLRGKQYAVAGSVAALAVLGERLGSPRAGKPALVEVPGIDVPFHSSALRDGVESFRAHLLAKLPDRIDPAALVGRYVPNLYPVAFRLDRDYVAAVRDTCGSSVLDDVLADWDRVSADPPALTRTLLVELLAWQFASPVRWIETFELLCTPAVDGGLGIERIVEVGLGSAPTLANLAKGSLALPGHRGTRPEVRNVEVDADAVLEVDEDPAAPAEEPEWQAPETDQAPGGFSPVAAPVPGAQVPAAAPVPGAPVPVVQGVPAASSSAPVPAAPDAAAPGGAPAAASATPADLPVDHATALGALLALRVGVRPEQLEHDSIEALVDGASSRRNQVLMDLGKEFGVPAIDGAHEAPLVELTATLVQRASGYRYPGPVLAAAVDGALTGALGPLGASAGALTRRVTDHWGLAGGWADRAALALALGTRDGSSRRGGELGTLTGGTAEELIDAAVRAAAAEAGVAVAPPQAASQGGAVDAAAVTELREHVEGILVDQASEVLARLGRLPSTRSGDADHREALARLALLESEHGAAALVAPAFDPRRHVLLASSAEWARADIEHLVQAALRADAYPSPGAARPEVDAARPAGPADAPHPDAAHLEDLIAQIALHRDADPRVRRTLEHHRTRLADRGGTAPGVIERALAAEPRGVTVPDLPALTRALATGAGADVLAALSQLGTPGRLADQVALVTGASPGSIAWSTVAHLLRGGATVVVVTTSDTPERIAAYRDLERRTAAPGAQLHVVRANLASFADIDGLLDWLTTPTTETVGPVTRQVKPALWPTVVLPFAAAPAGGELPDAGEQAEATLRLLLLGVQRLVGGLADRAAAADRDRFTVVLPMSPNHGTFGGDGAYGEAKAALETMVNRWTSERARWGSRTRLVAAEIGWVRGTGLMAGNDAVAGLIEAELGVVTFAAEQMGALIAAVATPEFAARADAGPVRVDLTGGLSAAGDVGPALARAAQHAAQERSDEAGPAADRQARIAALPGLPEALRTARRAPSAPDDGLRPRVAAEDMVVLVGVAEYGPWGGSATRWQAETGQLSAAGVVELAWRSGLIDWDSAAGRWADAETGEPVAESELAPRYRDRVEARVGVRRLEATDEVAADGSPLFAEVFLDKPLTTVVGAEAEARALAAGAAGALVTRAEQGWLVSLPAGSAVRVRTGQPLKRSVGGQFPTGSDPTRLGLDVGAAASMDPLAAWNVVITAEALADAGVTPEELVGAVHPSLVGNTQGTGMGGMSSIHALYMAPALGRPQANDVLQEALGNVVPAHVNQGLVGGYGPMVHPVAACATAAVSLEEAVDKIALGKAEVVIAGGWDDLGTEGINGFASMAATADNDALVDAGLTPEQHSRPGDRRRRGFVESQGGGSFVVCRGSVALRLGLPVRAVVGYAASFGDGINTSIPAPGLGAIGAARGGIDSPLGRALADLGLRADDIAVVSKHDTSTEANDPNEAFIHATVQSALGRSPGAPLRVISQKSLTGHAKGGAAAWQIAGVCDVFATGVVPGNRNLVSVDPRVAPDPLVVDDRPLVRAEPVRAALVTSLGFGHVSAVVALAHPDVFAAAIAPEQREAYLARAHQRRVAGARLRLAAQHDGPPVLARRTDRRLGRGTAQQLRDREARLLLDPDGTLGPGGSSSGALGPGAQQSAARPFGVVPSGSAGPGVPPHIAPRPGGPAAGEATR